MWIVDLFAELCDPDPTQFQPLIDGMEQTALAIHDDPKQLAVSPVSQYVEDARGKIEQWEGEAAETFRVNFINKLELAAQNQAFIAGVMMHAMIDEQDIFVKVRQDLPDLAKQTVNAIEAADNTDPGGIKTIFGVAAASLNGWYNELTGPGRATHFLPPEPSLVHEPDSQLRNDFLPP